VNAVVTIDLPNAWFCRQFVLTPKFNHTYL